MPLILAVEPDPLQIAHVTALTRGKPRTELIIAESPAAAVNAIASRIPDVLLLSPRLPPNDRERITGCLKKLGAAAAHVKTFTTPMQVPAGARRSAASRAAGRLAGTPAAAAPPTRGLSGDAVQDEWGFYNPDLCGFSALGKREQPRKEDSQAGESEQVLVRLISY